jgi:hypothetical protein
VLAVGGGAVVRALPHACAATASVASAATVAYRAMLVKPHLRAHHVMVVMSCTRRYG